MSILDSKIYPPNVSDTKDVETMLKDNYGLTVKSLVPLNGYEDRNYHIEVEMEHKNPFIDKVCPHGYTVKIVNVVDSNRPDFLLGQKLVMDHVRGDDVKCQNDVKSLHGKFFSNITLGTGDEAIKHVVLVRTFIPGVVVCDVTLTSSLVHNIGLFVATIGKALEGFEFPFYETYSPFWNMDNFLVTKAVRYTIQDEERIRLVEEVFNKYETIVIPRKEKFRKGLIHGDLNEQNILVEPTTGGHRVCGILDFQHTTYSYYLYDLTISLAYLMTVPKSDIGLPVIDIGGYILAGYLEVSHLNEAEKACLKVLAASRMVMSLLMGAYNYSLNPTNDYMLQTSRVGWRHLFEFWKTPEDELWERWNEIVKSRTT